MKLRLTLLLACMIYVAPNFAQNTATSVKLTDLLRSPEKYDRELVEAEGFLHIDQEKPHGIVSAFLYLNHDDIQQLPPLNSIVVVPSRPMIRDRAKLDRSEVSITGTFRSGPSVGGTRVFALRDIRACVRILRLD